ncbi:MAG: hypothetical protein SH857_02815 [Chitinophagales bacterium]|nr:hypothetical protein [Chitinophagales bacterium]
MIRFFNVNNPSVIVFVFFYVLLLNSALFFSSGLFPVAATHAPFSNLFFSLTGFLFGNNHYVLSLLSIVLVFAQSLMMNNLVNNAKVFTNGTYVPAIIYALLASLFTEFLFLTPVLLATLFLILAIGKALKLYKQHHAIGDIYDMSFLIGIASLFYMPFALLLLLVFVSLAVMRSFNWREWVAGLLGFFSIYFLTGTWFFLTDGLKEFLQQHLFPPVAQGVAIDVRLGLYVVGILTAVLVVAASFIFLLNFLKSTIHTRKFLTLMGWTIMLLPLSALLGNGLTLNHFVALSVPLCLLISYLFLTLRKVRIANALHLLWLIAVLFFQYYHK